MKTIILIISSVFLLSCKKTDLEKKITEKDSFWYVFSNDEEKNMYMNNNYGYHFFFNGKLNEMRFDFSTDSLKTVWADDIKPCLDWEHSEEFNSLNLQCREYDILKFEEDTIVLKHIKSNKKRILINLRNKNPEVLKIYKATSKNNSLGLKKGDHIYLDNLHKNHYEVFDKRGNAKSVLNLDGTINAKKTQKVLDAKRTIDIK